jgi:septum formation protein
VTQTHDQVRPKLVLASASPRRQALLQQIGIEPDFLLAADLDETPQPHELPRDLALRLSREKATSAASTARKDPQWTSAFVLAADTVVAVGRRILPKCETSDEARQCLALLSGRTHRVYTGVALATPKGAVRQRVLKVVCVSSGFQRLRLPPTSPHMNGMAKQVAMRSRDWRALLSSN